MADKTAKSPSVDPFGSSNAASEGPQAICCPVCSKANFKARQNQWTSWRECLECGNVWSGGMAGQPDFSLPENRGLLPNPGLPAPDDDLPHREMGYGFRDPGKSLDYGDE